MIDIRRRAPVSTATLDALVMAIADRDASARSVAAVVDQDPGLLSRVLSLANSAFFGLSRRVEDAVTGVGLVGMETTRTLAISGATGLLDSRCGLPGVRDHALLVAAGARHLAPRAGVRPSVAFTAGMLHDLGELLLWQAAGEEYRIFRDAAVDPRHQLQIEQELFGTDHALLAGEHLLEWRLPDPIVTAVADHHEPHPLADRLTLVVAAADELATGCLDSVALRLLEISPEESHELQDVIVDQGVELSAVLTPV